MYWDWILIRTIFELRLRLSGDDAGVCRCWCYYEIRSLTAAVCCYCRVRRFVDGMSSSERSGLSEAEGFETDPSCTIAATDSSYLTVGSLPA